MTRERALEISDALVQAGETHTVAVGVHDGFMPRERYTVSVTPLLSRSAIDISRLQRLADGLGSGIGYVQGSFVFTDAKA